MGPFWDHVGPCLGNSVPFRTMSGTCLGQFLNTLHCVMVMLVDMRPFWTMLARGCTMLDHVGDLQEILGPFGTWTMLDHFRTMCGTYCTMFWPLWIMLGLFVDHVWTVLDKLDHFWTSFGRVFFTIVGPLVCPFGLGGAFFWTMLDHLCTISDYVGPLFDQCGSCWGHVGAMLDPVHV